jgi:H+-translocating NAD(P) transhydrogenase subunit alpha
MTQMYAAASGAELSSGIALLTIFVLSVFVGFEVVSKVSTVLHTPLMSGANAIHGVVLVGAILITGTVSGPVQLTLGTLAIVLGTVNMVGGFVVTDRMLEMFSRPSRTARGAERPEGGAGAAGRQEPGR